MTGGKKITSYSLSPLSPRRSAIHVDTSIRHATDYPCSYCNEESLSPLNPYTQTSGGAIQRELAKHTNTGEVLAVLQTFGICGLLLTIKDSKDKS